MPSAWFLHSPASCTRIAHLERTFGPVKWMRRRIIDRSNEGPPAERLMVFVRRRDERAHPCRWTER